MSKSRNHSSTGKAAAAETGDPRRWRALAALALVQFMIVIDNTVVNVALPSIQHDLRLTTTGLAWVVNGYLLTAGGLLLLGGRIADLLGRRKMFLIGTAVFAAASLGAGLAVGGTMLLICRFLQGAGEAMAAPAALSMVPLLFTDDKERAKAFGVWGGLAGLGAMIGVVLSGIIVDLIDWRWIFFINIPLAALPLLLVPRLIDESRSPNPPRRIDFPGAVLVTAGTTIIVYALLSAATHSWGSANVLVPLLIGIAALAAFVVRELNTPEPLVPMRFFANRTRVSANACTVLMASSMMAMFFLIVQYGQNILHYSPLQSGLAYVPFCLAFAPGLMISMRLVPRIGAGATLAIGFAISAVGMFLLSGISVGGSYVKDLLPAMIVLAIGLGMANPALQQAALHGVSQEDSGLASGVQQTVMQGGSALGLAVFVTLATRRTLDQTAGGTAADAAAAAGYRLAFVICAIVLAIGAVAAFVFIQRDREPVPTTPAAPVRQEPVAHR
jgi:EmrB/QacA subfamily drug resistance transporter